MNKDECMSKSKVKIVLEGTDGVGKTSTIKLLKDEGILCDDRCKNVISKYMLFSVSMQERVKIYEKYLKNNDVKVLFLINNDGNELMKRIHSREVISSYDEDAILYNELYLITYNYMKMKNKLYDKLFLVDCTNLSLNEQVQRVREIINA